jgi:hypothetical protein
MKRNHHLKELIDNIKKTDEMISMHKANGTSPLMSIQYEALKAKQTSELIDSLALPPFQTIESIFVIKRILNKFYPDMPESLVQPKELKELADAI